MPNLAPPFFNSNQSSSYNFCHKISGILLLKYSDQRLKSYITNSKNRFIVLGTSFQSKWLTWSLSLQSKWLNHSELFWPKLLALINDNYQHIFIISASFLLYGFVSTKSLPIQMSGIRFHLNSHNNLSNKLKNFPIYCYEWVDFWDLLKLNRNVLKARECTESNL